MNDTTERIGRIALFANGLAAGNAHPTLIPDLVMLDEAGRPPLHVNGAQLRTDPDSPICVYAANPPLFVPGVLAELIIAIDDRDTFPAHRDEREQQTADAVTRLLEQATEARIGHQALHENLQRVLHARSHIIEQARDWKAAYINAFAEAAAVSRTIEYRERRADEAEQAAERRHRALDDRERALVKREQRAARSVEQAVNRSNHSNELVEQARGVAASAQSLAEARRELNQTLHTRMGKITAEARRWKQRALAAESAEAGAPITIRPEITAESIEAVINRFAAYLPEPRPATGGDDAAATLLSAIADELTPGRRDRDLVLAARELSNDCSKAEIQAQKLGEQIVDRDHVIALRDADVDELKARLTAALESRSYLEPALEMLISRAHDEAEHIVTVAPRRAHAARSSARHIITATSTAARILHHVRAKTTPASPQE